MDKREQIKIIMETFIWDGDKDISWNRIKLQSRILEVFDQPQEEIEEIETGYMNEAIKDKLNKVIRSVNKLNNK